MTSTASAWERIHALIKAGDLSRLALGVLDLAEDERGSVAREVRAWVRRPPGHDRSYADEPAAAIVGAGVLDEPARMSAWLSRYSLRFHRPPARDDPAQRHQAASVVPQVFFLLTTRDLPWLARLVALLAERLPKDHQGDRFELVERLCVHTGAPMPLSDGYVTGWVAAHPSDDVFTLLAGESHATELVTRFFELDQVGTTFARYAWPGTVAELVGQGTVARAPVVDACLARLARGGRKGATRSYLACLQQLACTPAEQLAHVADFLALLDSDVTTAVTHAQGVLTGLADTGALGLDSYADATARALRRPEKKVVQAQLRHAETMVARDNAVAAAVAAAIVGAVTGSTPDVQRAALLVVGSWADALPPSARTAVLEQAGALPADLVGSLAARWGAVGPRSVSSSTSAHVEVPGRVRLERIDALPAYAAHVHRLVEGWLHDLDTPDLECLIEGALRFGAADRSALLAALRPTLGLPPFQHKLVTDVGEWPADRHLDHALAGLLCAVTGYAATAPLAEKDLTGIDGVLRRRVMLLTAVVDGETVPASLSFPSWVDGAIEPAALIARLQHVAAEQVCDVELEQALLRLEIPHEPGERRTLESSLRAIGSPPARRAADWVATGQPPRPEVIVLLVPPDPQTSYAEFVERPDRLLPEIAAPGRDTGFDGGLWTHLTAPGPGRTSTDWWGSHDHPRCWSALVPWHRDVVALHSAAALARATEQTQGVSRVLGPLARTGGDFGVATALALGYALATKRADQGADAVAAVSTMLARDVVDPALLGRTIADLARRRCIVAKRLVTPLREIAASGLDAQLWPVLVHALPVLLGEPGLTGLADLIGVAAEVAERLRPGGTIDGLEQFAGAKGSARRVVEARRLRDLLAG